MKKFGVASLVLIIILGVLAILYFDIFNLRFSKEAAIASIISAEDIRRVSSEFDKYLSDPDPDIRTRTALAIGRIGDVIAADRLFGLLDDSVSEVAETAAFAIGLTGEKSYAARLLDQCGDFPSNLLAASLQSVGRLSDSSMTEVNEMLASYLDHVDHRVREQAVYALWRGGAKAQASRLMNICRADPVRPVQVAALYSLVRMEIADQADLYSEWLPDADPFVRSLALRGLSLAKDEGKVSLIASGLNDRDNNVVSQAVSSLASIGSTKAVKFLRDKYARETDERLKVQLLEAFTKLENSGLMDFALDDVHNDSSTVNVTASAIVYLAAIGKGEYIPLIDSLADMDNTYLNTKIAGALEKIGGEEVKPRLVSLYKDSLAAVRAAAFTALCEVDRPNIDYYLRTALGDRDYVVNSLAVEKIGELRKRQYLPQMMTIMQMRDRAEVDLKRSIVAAMAEFLEEDKTDSLAEDILYHALLDNEYLVSRQAAEVYMEKLDTDKSAFVNRPYGLIGKRKIKSLLNRYKRNPHAVIITNRGEIELELYFDVAPLTVYNFIRLSREGFYDGLMFHRVVPNFVIQGGDPRGDGWGGPGYAIRCEPNDLTFKRGAVGMAHSGKDTGGSQFFITLSPQPHLDARFTLFGQVVSGMEVVDQIVRGDMIEHISIVQAEGK
jgi:cyclophilin family peptidyl-prolyl cis-trans isomerase/HEAT repeat protein